MVPYFEKYLTEVDVEKQMEIPGDFIEHLPHHGGGWMINFPVQEVSGKVWKNFRYNGRPRDSHGHSKLAFQGDWHDYVRAKGLKPGDKIIFRAEENGVDGALRYTIAAQKKNIAYNVGTVFWTMEM